MVNITALTALTALPHTIDEVEAVGGRRILEAVNLFTVSHLRTFDSPLEKIMQF